MKLRFVFLVFATQSACAGLQQYTNLVVADPPGSSAPRENVRVTYLGTNGYQFESGGHTLLVDPYFSRVGLSGVALGARVQPDLNRINEARTHLMPKADAIVVTHGHFDHLLDAPILMQKTGAQLVGSSTAVELARRVGAPPERCQAIKAGDIRRIGTWKITAFATTHDKVFPIGVPFPGEPKTKNAPQRAADWVCGEPLAFVIEVDGQRIFVDSGGTPESLPDASIGPVDLAILGVALADSRARFSAAVQRVRPRYLLPSHQDNFFRPLKAGFTFGPLTNFPEVLRDYQRNHLPGRLILLDYFKPWTLARK